MAGKIDISKLNNPPEKHELITAKFFSELGFDVEFIPPSFSPKVHTPDIVMDGVMWEIKNPTGQSSRTIENNFRKGNKQSENIIFDLRRIKLPKAECISKIEREFALRPRVKRVLIITKDKELIRLPQKITK